MSQRKLTKEDILGFEAKHITYVRDQTGAKHDLLVVKEKIHVKGKKEPIPRLRLFRDYKKTFYITKPALRKHKEKKVAEFKSNLQEYQSTEINWPTVAARALDVNPYGARPRQLARSPFLYGTDVSTACVLKQQYMARYPDLRSVNTVCGLDIETDVIDDIDKPILLGATFKDKGVLFINREWYKGDEEEIKKEVLREGDNRLGKVFAERKMIPEIIFSDTAGQMIIGVAKFLHAWKPDFVAIWNISFEMNRFVETAKKEGIDLAQVFSDPSIPPEFKYFNFKEGETSKTSASGKKQNKDLADKWDWVTCPASFQFIDAMSIYRLFRVTGGKEPNYKLDGVLERQLGLHKLKMEGLEHLTGGRWHEVMQKKHKAVYAIYNLFDCIALEMLDEKTKDLAVSVSTNAQMTEYKNLNSNPKRLCDDMHFWYLARPNPKVMASSSDQMKQELDEMVVSPRGWIITLQAYLIAPHGICCVKDNPHLVTMVYPFVADLDVEATYPNVSRLLNMGPETRAAEFSTIKGISSTRRKAFGVNLTGGNVNAVMMSQEYFNAPSLDSLLAGFTESEEFNAA